MRQRRIALVVDHPQRDLPAMVRVADELCRDGARVYLVPMNRQQYELPALAPDFVLINYLRLSNQGLVRDLMAAGMQVGVLDNEGGVLASFDWFGGMMADDAKLRHSVNCFCSWGTRFADHAVQSGWYTKSQMHVTGMPRFDYYVAPWRKIPLPGVPDLSRYNHPLVLLNGSFSIANPGQTTPEDEIRRMVHNLGYAEDDARTIQDVQRQTMEGLIDLTNHVTERFPGLTFVFRPHPFERIETYHELLTARPNLHIIREGSVIEWIFASDVVVQRGCTTAIEAGMAGKPALSPRWMPMPREIQAVEDASIHCDSQAEVDGFLQTLADEGKMQVPEDVRKRAAKVVEDWFLCVDGKSGRRVADVIQSSFRNGGSVDAKRCRAIYYGRPSGDSLKARLLFRVRKGFGLPVQWSLNDPKLKRPIHKWRRSVKYFDEKIVRELTHHIAAARGGIEPISKLQVETALALGEYRLPHASGGAIVLQMENLLQCGVSQGDADGLMGDDDKASEVAAVEKVN